MARGNQSIVERAGILLGPTIVVGLDDPDAVSTERRRQYSKGGEAHRENNDYQTLRVFDLVFVEKLICLSRSGLALGDASQVFIGATPCD